MRTKRIDGNLFAQMLANGIYALQAVEKQLNAMNVFPVADGDTGTNMLATLRNGVRCASDTHDLSAYLKSLSAGMLLGARGNSGVILSQIFKGIYLELSKRSVASVSDMRNAFIRGYKVAYEVVIHPQEGTILTVTREGIENAARQIRNGTDMEGLFQAYLANMQLTLARTPELLPVLAEMGVVDSGGKGYIALIQGMADFLNGIIHTGTSAGAAPEAEHAPAAPALDFNAFNADSSFDEGYCMEFILQLLHNPHYQQAFDDREFTAMLEAFGESLVVVRDDTRVKVHIHTKKPSPIITFAQQFGEFLTFKLENMQLQHNDLSQKNDPPEKKEIHDSPRIIVKKETAIMATIAAVNGSGMKDIFQNLGCSQIIECGPTMSASAEEFLSAIELANAEHVVILPGNPNLILAAQQAASLSHCDVTVLEAKTIPEAYFALAMDIQDSDDYVQRIEQMRMGIENVDTLQIAVAARSFSHNGISFSQDKVVAIYRNEPVLSADDPIEAIEKSFQMVEDIDDKSICVFIRGKDTSADQMADIEARLQSLYPMLECSFLDGGQQIYNWIIGLS